MDNEERNIEEEKTKNEEEVFEEKEEIKEEDSDFDENQEVFTYTVDNNINNEQEKGSFIYIIIGFVILFIIIITLVVFVNNKDKKTTGYTSIETKLEEAAKMYYKKYPEQLPTDTNNNKSVSAETLIEKGVLKPFEEMVKENVKCTGIVNVHKIESEYSYFPYLNCGKEYKSTKLQEKIIEDNLVTIKDGLYNKNGEYIFRGEYVNNYVKFNDKTWRILKLNNDGSIKMMLVDKKTEHVVWDDRYNIDKKSYIGINDLKISRLLETLKKTYEDNKILNANSKKLLVKRPWCIDRISEKNMPISNLEECTETYDDLYIGLINVKEVLEPSLDENCTNIYSQSCTNYNYLYKINTGWTLNTSSENTYKAFSSNHAEITSKNTSSTSIIRPVININGNVLYKKGNGTKAQPYEL